MEEIDAQREADARAQMSSGRVQTPVMAQPINLSTSSTSSSKKRKSQSLEDTIAQLIAPIDDIEKPYDENDIDPDDPNLQLNTAGLPTQQYSKEEIKQSRKKRREMKEKLEKEQAERKIAEVTAENPPQPVIEKFFQNTDVDNIQVINFTDSTWVTISIPTEINPIIDEIREWIVQNVPLNPMSDSFHPAVPKYTLQHPSRSNLLNLQRYRDVFLGSAPFPTLFPSDILRVITSTYKLSSSPSGEDPKISYWSYDVLYLLTMKLLEWNTLNCFELPKSTDDFNCIFLPYLDLSNTDLSDDAENRLLSMIRNFTPTKTVRNGSRTLRYATYYFNVGKSSTRSGWHWMLIFFDLALNVIYFYDPLQSNDVLQQLPIYMINRLKKVGATLNGSVEEWEIFKLEYFPRLRPGDARDSRFNDQLIRAIKMGQKDGYSCGFYCFWILALLKNYINDSPNEDLYTVLDTDSLSIQKFMIARSLIQDVEINNSQRIRQWVESYFTPIAPTSLPENPVDLTDTPSETVNVESESKTETTEPETYIGERKEKRKREVPVAFVEDKRLKPGDPNEEILSPAASRREKRIRERKAREDEANKMAKIENNTDEIIDGEETKDDIALRTRIYKEEKESIMSNLGEKQRKAKVTKEERIRKKLERQQRDLQIDMKGYEEETTSTERVRRRRTSNENETISSLPDLPSTSSVDPVVQNDQSDNIQTSGDPIIVTTTTSRENADQLLEIIQGSGSNVQTEDDLIYNPGLETSSRKKKGKSKAEDQPVTRRRSERVRLMNEKKKIK